MPITTKQRNMLLPYAKNVMERLQRFARQARTPIRWKEQIDHREPALEFVASGMHYSEELDALMRAHGFTRADMNSVIVYESKEPGVRQTSAVRIALRVAYQPADGHLVVNDLCLRIFLPFDLWFSERAAGPGQRIETTIQAFAAYLIGHDGPFQVSSNGTSCHRVVADAILKRGNANDKVWLLGWKTPETVLHSVLTDANNRVVKDSASGKLSRTSYIKGDTVLEVLRVVGVDDLYELAAEQGWS